MHETTVCELHSPPPHLIFRQKTGAATMQAMEYSDKGGEHTRVLVHGHYMYMYVHVLSMPTIEFAYVCVQ